MQYIKHLAGQLVKCKKPSEDWKKEVTLNPKWNTILEDLKGLLDQLNGRKYTKCLEKRGLKSN